MEKIVEIHIRRLGVIIRSRPLRGVLVGFQSCLQFVTGLKATQSPRVPTIKATAVVAVDSL